MVASKLTLYNGALNECGERRLASLTEAVEPRYLLDGVWDRGAVDFCLGRGQWRFARRTREMQADSDIDPAFGHRNGFEIPTDHIRTVALCSDEYLRTPLLDYHVEAGIWYSDVDPIYVSYVSNDASFGGDYSLWTKEFERYVEAYLASMIVTRLTDGMSKRDAMEKLVKKRLLEAKSRDAMESPTSFPPQGSWVSSRTGSSRGDRGSRSSLTG